jgi:YfiH family protein
MYVQAPGVYRGFDALVTDRPRLTLGILVADCAVVLLADAVAGIVGAAHAGWRGVAGGIVGTTVDEMLTRGAAVERMRAYVSPCISVKRFEVGDEVARRFESAFVERDPSRRRPHVDLKRAILGQLVHRGLASASIEVSQECTFDADFFSHRATGGVTGRMMGFIALRLPRS